MNIISNLRESWKLREREREREGGREGGREGEREREREQSTHSVTFKRWGNVHYNEVTIWIECKSFIKIFINKLTMEE